MECEFILLSPSLLWPTPTWPSWAFWHMHAPTFNKWHKKKKKTFHILKHGAMRGCGLTSLEVCINDKIRDRRERNVTIRSEIWTTNIRSLGFWDIREWVILWRLILRSLGCTWNRRSLEVCDDQLERLGPLYTLAKSRDFVRAQKKESKSFSNTPSASGSNPSKIHTRKGCCLDQCCTQLKWTTRLPSYLPDSSRL